MRSRVLTMPDSSNAVTVIIPTLALPQRAELLHRAIASVHAQQGVRTIPLVVVNGPSYEPRVVAALRKDSRVRLLTVPRADLPGALAEGRAHVCTACFTSLDDDDVLLPEAMRVRLRALTERPDCVAAVTNGWRRDAQGDTLHVSDMDEVRRDPLHSLMQFNWLLPGAWLARTDAFGKVLFERMPRYLECTWLAVHLATTLRSCFLEEPTVVWSVDTPQSASKSREYVVSAEAALRRILELDLPADVRYGFRKKLAGAQDAAARLYMKEGDRRAAWERHLRSLRGPGFWRFLPLTPRLFLMSVSGAQGP